MNKFKIAHLKTRNQGDLSLLLAKMKIMKVLRPKYTFITSITKDIEIAHNNTEVANRSVL